ncbi:hypothetical protein KQI42_09010 [Tissierella sp. MSJ-40]|uniref:Uncharacterized protein n=1 Tax=Tissierella simiarum TaxID=2841534 RepID=A0ABS6E5N3_9FIRM|nr:hypothetical protein [Tissierella simiarum]MBU5438146.1 hypothetical protein [Tissierella simiarum]
MKNNIIKEYGLVHDNIIISYMVDFEKQILQINTKSYDEEVVIRFQGLLAHVFENVLLNNIILEIYQVTIECFLLEKVNRISEVLKYGFPTIEVSNIKELEDYLKEKEYRVFYLTASLWMCGYIIAKEIILM